MNILLLSSHVLIPQLCLNQYTIFFGRKNEVIHTVYQYTRTYNIVGKRKYKKLKRRYAKNKLGFAEVIREPERQIISYSLRVMTKRRMQ